MMWGSGYFFGIPWGMTIGLIFWVLLILGIVYLIYRLGRISPAGIKGAETPLKILKKRYAAGEIDAAEFARRKKDLET